MIVLPSQTSLTVRNNKNIKTIIGEYNLREILGQHNFNIGKFVRYHIAHVDTMSGGISSPDLTFDFKFFTFDTFDIFDFYETLL